MSHPPDRVRSFALVGHGGHGKTSVGDAIARVTGRNTRLGRVGDHSSILDFEPEEHKREGSIAASFLSCSFDGYHLHVVDTPGDGNFLHEARTVLQATNAAVIVVSAVDGVEVSTEQVSGYAANQGVPRALFLNKMDREYADWRTVIAECEEALGLTPVLMQLPIGEADDFRGVIDLVNRKAFLYSGDSGTPTEAEIPEDQRDEVEAAIERMMESVAMADDELVEKYLDAGELTQAEIRRGLNVGILSGSITPVLLGSAAKNIAVDRICWLARAFPHCGETGSVVGTAIGDPETLVEVDTSPDGPFAALCVKSIIDPFAGQISVFRVVRGSLDANSTVLNARTEKPERLGSLLQLYGKHTEPIDRVVAGDIFGVAKLKDTHTGDTVCDPDNPVVLPYIGPKPAMISYTIKPKSRADVDKLKTGLTRLLAEDPALRQSYDDVTHELVLSGMGANHVQISVEKLARKFGVEVELGTPAIPYRETIQGTADVRYRHKKQSGGAGQFGEVAIRVAPASRGDGFVFVDAIKGGVIPGSLIPSVEKGVGDQLKKGVLAGFPCDDVRVELYDGKYHPVDSKDIAFQIAGRQAIKEAVMKARPILMEPIYIVDVVVPGDHVGDVMGDLNQRRGRVLNMESRGRNSVVKAMVPLAEMLGYSPDLRSMTGGKGSYTMEFHGYEAVPQHMQARLVDEIKRHQEEED